MSYEIEYNREVYFVDGKDGWEKDYFLLIKQGSNNCYEADSGMRERSWDLRANGWEYQLWYEIGSRGGGVEGGGLQRAVGWTETKRWTIEEYIALYRKAIKNAKPLTEMFKKFEIEYRISARDTIKDEYGDKKIKELIAKYQMIQDGVEYYHEDIKRYKINVENAETFLSIWKAGGLTGRYGTDYWGYFYFKRLPQWKIKMNCREEKESTVEPVENEVCAVA